MQRLLVHRASFDRVDDPDLLEAALDSLDQRTLARTYRSHQVEDLAALFALERRRMEIADDLRDGALNSKELLGEEIEHLQRLILEEPLGARIVGVGQRMKTYRDNQVIDPRVRELGHDRVGFHDLQIFEQSAAPLLRLTCSAVFLDHSLEVIEIRHRLSPSGSGYRILDRNTAWESVYRSGRTISGAHLKASISEPVICNKQGRCKRTHRDTMNVNRLAAR